ncbi:FAD-dependent monooxygenase [Mycobacterium vicinigordonae]|uniref:FAD-dependent monooxygenase n=1 Tax=Mycobacterium vicinigordonae TaxID=1719132 RepID=A0A7D6E3P9_9MYCO|nr:FAD-dependent monooxygenase [Mycobacterium vicinigordonae]QLL06163.1 FAD-dependent monooxygenase [Mycobacterium vicinigordonae]
MHDRLDLDGTLGFGVGLSGAALEVLGVHDPETRELLEEHALRFHEASFCLPRGTYRLPGFSSGIAISRPELRRLLCDQATKAGVVVENGRAADVDEFRGSADLIIAADGVSSPTRDRYAAQFGARVIEGRGVYLWCGADLELPGAIFAPVATEHGVFTTHAYPYATGRSAFVIESTEETLRNAGLDHVSPTVDDDVYSIEYLSNAFADLLDGQMLHGNRSKWFHFRTVFCETWTHENIALLGDAAATADPSLGSGTKLTLDSAIALADALNAWPHREIRDCLERYDAFRRPAVTAFQELALRSQRWWDTFPRRLHLEGERLAVAYLTRGGHVSLDAALARSGDLIRPAVASWAQVDSSDLPEAGLAQWIVNRPFRWRSETFASQILSRRDVLAMFSGRRPETIVVDVDDPWGEIADALVAEARRALGDGTDCVVLTGERDRCAVLNRLHVAERMRMELGCLVAIDAGAEDIEDVAAGLVAGRIDFACTLSVEEHPGAAATELADTIA